MTNDTNMPVSQRLIVMPVMSASHTERVTRHEDFRTETLIDRPVSGYPVMGRTNLVIPVGSSYGTWLSGGGRSHRDAVAQLSLRCSLGVTGPRYRLAYFLDP